MYKATSPRYQYLLLPRHDFDPSFDAIKAFYCSCIGEDPQEVTMKYDNLVQVVNLSPSIPDDLLPLLFEYRPELIKDVKKDHPHYRRMAEIAIDHKPGLLEALEDQWDKLCKTAVKKSPHSLAYVKKQTAKLCDVAMKLDPTVYKHLSSEFKTYRYLMAYHKDLDRLGVILQKVEERSENIPDAKNMPKINRSFGVEVEFLVDGDLDEVFYLLKEVVDIENNIHPFNGLDRTKDTSVWSLKKDTSERNMYEVSSCILNSDSLNQLYKVMGVLSALHQFKRIRLSNSCGLHVHMDASDLTFADVISTVLLYKNNNAVIQKLLSEARVGNNYCVIPTDRHLYSWLMDEDRLSRHPLEDLQKNRNYAVNPMSYFYYKSVEFRQHESTLSFTEIMAWVYLLSKLVDKRHNRPRHLFLGELFKSLDIPQNLQGFYVRKYLATRNSKLTIIKEA